MTSMQIVRNDGLQLGEIPIEQRDYALCATAVFSNPKSIRFVPLTLIDDLLLEHVISAGSHFIADIPAEAISPYADAMIHVMYPHYADELNHVTLNARDLSALDQLYATVGLAAIKRS